MRFRRSRERHHGREATAEYCGHQSLRIRDSFDLSGMCEFCAASTSGNYGTGAFLRRSQLLGQRLCRKQSVGQAKTGQTQTRERYKIIRF